MTVFLKTSLRGRSRGTPGWVGGVGVGVKGGGGGVAGCHPFTVLPELAVQLCVLQVYTRDGIIDNG